MIGKEIQASSIIRSEKCSSVLSLFNFVGERCNPSFFLQEKIVQWRAIFCWIFWIFSEGTTLSESTLVFTY